MESGNQNFLFEQSKKLVPGGVHSPVRSFKGLTSTPRFIERGEGAFIYDVDGKDYIDFCMSFGPLILGHAHPKVLSALEGALKKGWSYGACEPYSLELAQYLLDRIPFVDKIRFVNSGTEAVMTALRLARGYTGRDKIIKFNGCYHGHVDSMLIKAGSGLAGTSEASSKGVPASISQDTLILDLGDEAGVRDCFERFRNQIAGIIIEAKRYGTNTISEIRSGEVMNGYLIFNGVSEHWEKELGTNVSAFYGDSGGPLLIDNKVAGVTSHGTVKRIDGVKHPAGQSVYVNLQSETIRNFIEEHLATANGENPPTRPEAPSIPNDPVMPEMPDMPDMPEQSPDPIPNC